MRILIDECLPKKLKEAISADEVVTVPEAGWAGKTNGELLHLMTDVYDVFITVDSSLQSQQQLGDLPIRFIVLSAHNNKLETLLPLMPQAQAALETIQPGEVVIIRQQSEG